MPQSRIAAAGTEFAKLDAERHHVDMLDAEARSFAAPPFSLSANTASNRRYRAPQ